jgi:hypothetical protein
MVIAALRAAKDAANKRKDIGGQRESRVNVA